MKENVYNTSFEYLTHESNEVAKYQRLIRNSYICLKLSFSFFPLRKNESSSFSMRWMTKYKTQCKNTSAWVWQAFCIVRLPDTDFLLVKINNITYYIHCSWFFYSFEKTASVYSWIYPEKCTYRASRCVLFFFLWNRLGIISNCVILIIWKKKKTFIF